MKKQLLFLLVLILSLNSYSQISFEKGYFINNSNEKINCLIKNIDWTNNPTVIEYKLTENENINKFTIESVKEFGIDNISKYINSKVNIDRSSTLLNKLSNDRNPKFKEEELFLKVLIEGKASLYEYQDIGLTRYFYSIENSTIEQLVFKTYETTTNKIAKNELYKQQLFNDLKCPDFNISNFSSLSYDKKDLLRIFTEYNKCLYSNLTYLEPKIKRDLFNLTIRPQLNNIALTVNDITFDNKTVFTIGVEAEYILPFNKNKWSLIIEPTYQSFKSEKQFDNANILGWSLLSTINYTSVAVSTGMRHYLFLNPNSKIFVNASFIYTISTKTTFESTYLIPNNENRNPVVSDKNALNFGIGTGYKYKNSYSLEIRYQTSRDILEGNPKWLSNYKIMSIIFGYTLF